MKIKVLYIAHSSALHGAGLALINIVSGMLSRGVEPVVFLPNFGPVSERLTALGVRCIFAHFYMEIYPPLNGLRDLLLWFPRLVRTLLSNHLAARTLRKIVLEMNPDIIHTNTGVLHFGSKVSRRCNIPHVWHIREFQDLDFGWTPIGGVRSFRKQIRKTNNYCVSITRDVFEHHGLNPSNACVIYDGVFDLRVPADIVWEKKSYFLFVGRIEEGKGIKDAIDAFIKVAPNYPQIQLWIAGDGVGAFFDSLRLLVEQSGLCRRLKFLGFRRDVYQLMSEAMAIIVPSRYEGFGFITTEAMLNGCLVIGNDTAGTKEQFDNGLAFCGEEIGIRYRGVDQLVQRVEEICSNPESLNRDLVKRAQSAVFQLYSVDKNVEKICKLYEEIINGKK